MARLGFSQNPSEIGKNAIFFEKSVLCIALWSTKRRIWLYKLVQVGAEKAPKKSQLKKSVTFSKKWPLQALKIPKWAILTLYMKRATLRAAEGCERSTRRGVHHNDVELLQKLQIWRSKCKSNGYLKNKWPLQVLKIAKMSYFDPNYEASGSPCSGGSRAVNPKRCTPQAVAKNQIWRSKYKSNGYLFKYSKITGLFN